MYIPGAANPLFSSLIQVYLRHPRSGIDRAVPVETDVTKVSARGIDIPGGGKNILAFQGR